MDGECICLAWVGSGLVWSCRPRLGVDCFGFWGLVSVTVGAGLWMERGVEESLGRNVPGDEWMDGVYLVIPSVWSSFPIFTFPTSAVKCT